MKSLARCASLLVTPPGAPDLTSARLIHSFSICGVQPILSTIVAEMTHRFGKRRMRFKTRKDIRGALVKFAATITRACFVDRWHLRFLLHGTPR